MVPHGANRLHGEEFAFLKDVVRPRRRFGFYVGRTQRREELGLSQCQICHRSVFTNKGFRARNVCCEEVGMPAVLTYPLRRMISLTKRQNQSPSALTSIRHRPTPLPWGLCKAWDVVA